MKGWQYVVKIVKIQSGEDNIQEPQNLFHIRVLFKLKKQNPPWKI